MWFEAVVWLWEDVIKLAHDRHGWKASLPILLGPILLVLFVGWLLLR